MNIFQMAGIALAVQVVALSSSCPANAQESPQPSAGEVVGEMVEHSSRMVARGVGDTSYVTADTLDGLSWAGCKVLGFVAGGERDRKPTGGNAIVGLGRLLIGIPSGSLCVVAKVLSVPAKLGGIAGTRLANARARE